MVSIYIYVYIDVCTNIQTHIIYTHIIHTYIHYTILAGWWFGTCFFLFIFPFSWEEKNPDLLQSYFSEGLKPPTSRHLTETHMSSQSSGG